MQCFTLRLVLLSTFLSTATCDTGKSRKLFGVYVYDDLGAGSIPDGWNNEDQRGCNPIVNVTRRNQLLDFLVDPANAVGVVKLDCKPLAKHNDTYWPAYIQMVQTLAENDVTVHLMVSDTPSDFLTWEKSFHANVDALLVAVPSARIGITYDIEGDQGNSALWKKMYDIILGYDKQTKAARPMQWAGFTFWGPFVAFQDGAPLYEKASAIEWGTYVAGDPQDFRPSINELAQFINASTNNAKVSVGLQMGFDHGLHCDRYSTCVGSMLWGKGVDRSKQKTLADWVDQVLSPELDGLSITSRLSVDAPFYVESVAGYMAFQRNLKNGRLPCTTCTSSITKGFCAPGHYSSSVQSVQHS
jgi:hypothetical protein